MSVDHENVSWQRADGTWAIGGFLVTATDDDGDALDYDYTTFMWAKGGFASMDDAIDGWCEDNANAGSYGSTQDPEAIAVYEAALKARQADDADLEQRNRANRYRGGYGW